MKLNYYSLKSNISSRKIVYKQYLNSNYNIEYIHSITIAAYVII